MAELHLLGTIVGASDFLTSGLYLRYTILTGTPSTPWQILSGAATGTTHTDTAPSSFPFFNTGSGKDAVFDHPIDVHFGVASLIGWPKLQIEVWNRDNTDNNTLLGYGFANFPSVPGHHKIDIVCWRPLGTFRERLVGFFLGANVELEDKEIIGRTRPGEGRFGLSAVTTGVVYLEVEVVVGGFEKNGVVL